MAKFTTKGCWKMGGTIKRKIDVSDMSGCVEGNVVYGLRSDGVILTRVEFKYQYNEDSTPYWNRGGYSVFGSWPSKDIKAFQASLEELHPGEVSYSN